VSSNCCRVFSRTVRLLLLSSSFLYALVDEEEEDSTDYPRVRQEDRSSKRETERKKLFPQPDWSIKCARVYMAYRYIHTHTSRGADKDRRRDYWAATREDASSSYFTAYCKSPARLRLTTYWLSKSLSMIESTYVFALFLSLFRAAVLSAVW